ncbi:MAG TPA: secretin N-terminal domain-containing protein [Thermoanaerobaculia bacterium]|nr:secretin N-terminal domain-containing protein [Thermoanaerobaculia bacterium]
MPRFATPLLVLLVLATLAPSAGPVAAQQPQGGARADALYVHAYTLKHQRAADALMLIHPLLSPRGTIELQPVGNTLVVRDTLAGLARVVPVLRGFDRPARPLRIEVHVVHASRLRSPAQAVSPALPEPPPELVQRLKALLSYEFFELVAQARVGGLEGQSVTYEIGGGFEVSFRLGTVMPNRRIRLTDFRILRRGRQRAGQTLLHTHLTLTLDQTVALALAKNEASPEALMVVLTPHQDAAQRLP